MNMLDEMREFLIEGRDDDTLDLDKEEMRSVLSSVDALVAPLVRDREMYALGLLLEEMGEAMQHLGRAFRFGIDSPNGDETTPRSQLSLEVGDVLAAIAYATGVGLLDPKVTERRQVEKLAKLRTLKDNLGRPLAP